MPEQDPNSPIEYKISSKAYAEELSKNQSPSAPTRSITVNSSLNDILIYARQQGASDVHLSSQNPIIIRKYSKLVKTTADPLEVRQMAKIITEGLPANIVENFRKTGDAEFVHSIAGSGRFRIALMKQRDGLDLTAHVIPTSIPTFEASGMPASCANLTKWAQGMVLVTGPAGCGKTTSLAILVELINKTRADHIITLESPIEIVYQPAQSQITQREIEIHTISQEHALRAALREDPDVIVVSELRDWATIHLATTAAETGHLVLGTMNTVNAAQTVSRLIDSFPADDQSNIRNMLSETLRGVICQQLIPKKDEKGLACAYEVMLVNNAISNHIRKGEITQMHNAITTGQSFGMKSMDHSLQLLVNNGIISAQDAFECAINPASFKHLLNTA